MQVTQIYLSDNNAEPPALLQRYIASVKRAFAHLPHVLYGDSDIQALIKEHIDSRVSAAYNKLIPYAYKSDLARLCIVYVVGGWYFDIGFYCPFPGVQFEPRIKLAAFRENPRLTPYASWSVANGLFYAQAGHPVLRRAIDIITHNCESNYYGNTPFCPTGPNVWGRAICEEGVAGSTVFGDFIELSPQHELKNRAMVLKNGQIAGFYKPTSRQGFRQTLEQMGAIGTNDFNALWEQKAIYNAN